MNQFDRQVDPIVTITVLPVIPHKIPNNSAINSVNNGRMQKSSCANYWLTTASGDCTLGFKGLYLYLHFHFYLVARYIKIEVTVLCPTNGHTTTSVGRGKMTRPSSLERQEPQRSPLYCLRGRRCLINRWILWQS